MRAAVAAVVLVVLAGRAHARDWEDLIRRVEGGVAVHYEVSGLRDIDATPGRDPGLEDLVLVGGRVHAVVGTGGVLRYHAGFDIAVGATLRGSGFAYDVSLFPVGVAVRVGGTALLALGVGVGAMGATGTLDDAVTFPIELIGEAGNAVRVLARARASYLAGARGRRDGAPSLVFADEIEAMIGVRVGHHESRRDFAAGNGYFVGVAYRELAGARFVGVAFGYSLDVASRRRR